MTNPTLFANEIIEIRKCIELMKNNKDNILFNTRVYVMHVNSTP